MVTEELKWPTAKVRFFVVGHGFGGMVATILAGLVPEWVKGLVLVSSYNLNDGWKIPEMEYVSDVK